jgi:hypothetical protein
MYVPMVSIVFYGYIVIYVSIVTYGLDRLPPALSNPTTFV